MRPLLLLLALPLPALAEAPQVPPFDPAAFAAPSPNRWFPLEPGQVRTYEATTEGGLERSTVTVFGPGPLILGVATVALLDEERLDDRLMERTLDYVATDDAGAVWYFGEDVLNFTYDEAGTVVATDADGTWRAGEGDAVPGMLMPAKPEVGALFYEEYAPAMEAMDYGRIDAVGLTLRGPAGPFEDVIKVFESSLVEPEDREFKFYAPGVGMVRAEEELDEALENPGNVVELAP